MNESVSPPCSLTYLGSRFYLSDALYLFKKHWLLVCLVPFLAATALLLFYVLSVKTFATSASVYMDPNFRQRISTEYSEDRAASPIQNDEQSLFSMEETICSDAMILRVLKKLNLLGDRDFLPASIRKRMDRGKEVTEARIIASVRKRYHAELLNSTRIIKVHVEDSSPERAALLAETFIAEFLGFLQEQRVQSELDLKQNLMIQANLVKERAIKSEQDLNQFREKHPEFLVEQDSGLFNQRMLEVGAELNQTDAELLKTKALLSNLESIDSKENPSRILNLAKGQYAVDFDQVLSQRAAALVRLEDVRQRFGPNHSDYRAAFSQVASINQAIAEHAAEIINSTRARFHMLSDQKMSIEAKMTALRRDFADYKSASAEFRGLKASVERDWQLYDKLTQRILSLTDQASLSPNVATPLGKPTIPFKPVIKPLIAGAAGGIFVSFAWIAVILGALIVRGLPLTSSRQIEEVLGLPLAATIARNQNTAGLLSSLPLLTGSTRVLHLTSAEQIPSAEDLCHIVSEPYLNLGQSVTVIRVTDQPGKSPYPFESGGMDTFEVSPAQIEIQKLRLKIVDFLNKEPGRIIIIDSTAVRDAETKLALARVSNASLVALAEDSVPREQARRWLDRFKQQSAHVLAIYQRFPFSGIRSSFKSLPQKSAANSGGAMAGASAKANPAVS